MTQEIPTASSSQLELGICHSPACDKLLGPLSEAPGLPRSPLRRRSHSGPHSGLALASRLSDTHPGRSHVHLEPPHVSSHSPRPPGTVSCLQRHPLLQPRPCGPLPNAPRLVYAPEPFPELYGHRSAPHTVPGPPSGLHHAQDHISSTDVSSARIPSTLRIQPRIGVSSDPASTAGPVLRRSGEAELLRLPSTASASRTPASCALPPSA
jgi:hypothetical protein